MDLRLDRLATLYLVSPLRRIAPEERLSIPILMYHSISEKDESRMHAYYRTTTSPSAFVAQMEYLHQNGYQTCSPAQAIALLQSDTEKAAKRVVITFDDGYRDFYREAFPVLSRFGLTATVFLPTAYIGNSTLQFKGQDCLTWSEVRELRKHGISFGSHTVTHPQLSILDSSTAKYEIVNSKVAIEDNLGEAVSSFAYPFAFPEGNNSFIRMLRSVLVESGYEQGVSTRIGTASRQEDRYFLRRLPMNSLDDLPLFDAKLQGGYDWLGKVQYGYKLMKN
jgi:peptidoglycan/xylan/chitin deacetylase (PgdA/CDA1 family)